MAYLGTKPANQVIDSTLIADGTITPSDLSTGKPVWDTSGNVGIGTATPSSKLQLVGDMRINAVATATTGLPIYAKQTNNDQRGIWTESATTDSNGRFYCDNSVVGIAASYSSTGSYLPITFTTSATERMRIDSNGVVRTTTRTGFSNSSGTIVTEGFSAKAGFTGAFSGNMFNINWTGSPQLWIDTTNIGTIQLSSDYRIKRNIETQTVPALERVMALRPVTYQMADYGNLFKASDDIKEGFIAHEVQEVIPSGAEGVKDDENQIQSLRVDAILAVAVKAIQEQQAIITELKTRIEALEQV
jgi:hypothetical protein